MKSRTISKIITALLLGILLASAVHHQQVKCRQLGRDGYLAEHAARFDKFYTKPPSVVTEVFVGVIMAGCAVGVYELVVYGVSRILKTMNEDDA